MLLARTRRARTKHLIAAGIVATGAVVLAGTAAQLIDYGFLDGRVAALDSATDGGIFGVVGDVSLALATAAAWTVLIRMRPVTAATVALPPILTFLTIDKAFRFHDHIPHWIVLYLPLLAAVFVAAVSIARRLSSRCFRVIAIALAMLAGAFLINRSGDWILREVGGWDNGWMWQVKAVVKHGLEVAGWLLMALGLYVGVEEYVDLRSV
ncbi:MAG TPA: hypothetical protein VGP91_11180 [Actinoplanes sp.]|nr:hypothetical protein [Actinoplanes sp.]